MEDAVLVNPLGLAIIAMIVTQNPHIWEPKGTPNNRSAHKR